MSDINNYKILCLTNISKRLFHYLFLIVQATTMAGRFCCGKSSQHPEGGNPRFASIVACTRLFTNEDKTSTHTT